MSLIFMAYIWGHVALRPGLVPANEVRATWGERLRGAVGVVPMAAGAR